MFQKLPLILLILLTLSACHVGRKTITDQTITKQIVIVGSLSVTHSKLQALTVNGTVNLTDVTIAKKLTVNGSVSAEKSTIQKLTANGTVHLGHSTITRLSKINGRLYAHHAIFKDLSTINGRLDANHATFDRIKINAKIINLTDSKTKKITVVKPNKPVQQVITLHNTSVDGDIVFKGGNGKVILRGTSKVAGNIIGGMPAWSSEIKRQPITLPSHLA